MSLNSAVSWLNWLHTVLFCVGSMLPPICDLFLWLQFRARVPRVFGHIAHVFSLSQTVTMSAKANGVLEVQELSDNTTYLLGESSAGAFTNSAPDIVGENAAPNAPPPRDFIRRVASGVNLTETRSLVQVLVAFAEFYERGQFEIVIH